MAGKTGWGLDGGIVDLMLLLSPEKVLFGGSEFRGRWLGGTGVSCDRGWGGTFVGDGKEERSFDFEIGVKMV